MDRSTARTLSFEGDARPFLVGLLAVQIFLGYEWLMSGLSKVLAGDFASGLAGTLSDQAKDLTGPYKAFLDNVVIPNGQLFGYLVMAGELALGLVLIVAPLVWLARWSRLATRGRTVILSLMVLAGVVAIFMNVNFHLMSGANHLWIIAADPNGEGIDLDSVMPVIQLIISVVSLNVLLSIRRAARTQVAAPARSGVPAA